MSRLYSSDARPALRDMSLGLLGIAPVHSFVDGESVASSG